MRLSEVRIRGAADPVVRCESQYVRRVAAASRRAVLFHRSYFPFHCGCPMRVRLCDSPVVRSYCVNCAEPY